ncbi:MAG: winged helix-turn-helix domain-containing protein [Desulfurococcales archaeon]|nr:winged helix-turn-helix domain-containing protein [Desulfurococcales archaeon]
MRLEDLCNPVTVRILRYILRQGQANVSRISRELGIHHRIVRKHMSELVRAGIVEEVRYERMRIYMARLRDPAVSALREVLEELERVVSLLGGADG